MFCVVIVLILVLFSLCYAPLRAFIFVLFYLLPSRISVFVTFGRVLCLPLSISVFAQAFVSHSRTRIMVIPQTMHVYAWVICFGTWRCCY
jgi:hypothetical protein